jgi:hypothetical protein
VISQEYRFSIKLSQVKNVSLRKSLNKFLAALWRFYAKAMPIGLFGLIQPKPLPGKKFLWRERV